MLGAVEESKTQLGMWSIMAAPLVIGSDQVADLDDRQDASDAFLLRRVRPIFEGTVFRQFDFRVMPDFGGGTTVLQDTYFDLRVAPSFRVRAGKSKTPIGYEILMSDPFVLFPERAIASSLMPNRDVGIQAMGDLTGISLPMVTSMREHKGYLYIGGILNNRIGRFTFDPDYHVDLILFRELIVAVTNAIYVKPSISLAGSVPAIRRGAKFTTPTTSRPSSCSLV